MSLINMTSKDGVTLNTAGKYCAEDITVVPTFESDSPLPIEVATEAEMTAILESATEAGGVYKYIGETTDTYENGALYVIEVSE